MSDPVKKLGPYIVCRDDQDDSGASIRMRNELGLVTKGGRSPTGVASPASARPAGSASGDRGRPVVRMVLSPVRNARLPGRHITDHQMRLFMSSAKPTPCRRPPPRRRSAPPPPIAWRGIPACRRRRRPRAAADDPIRWATV